MLLRDSNPLMGPSATSYMKTSYPLWSIKLKIPTLALQSHHAVQTFWLAAVKFLIIQWIFIIQKRYHSSFVRTEHLQLGFPWCHLRLGKACTAQAWAEPAQATSKPHQNRTWAEDSTSEIFLKCNEFWCLQMATCLSTAPLSHTSLPTQFQLEGTIKPSCPALRLPKKFQLVSIGIIALFAFWSYY